MERNALNGAAARAFPAPLSVYAAKAEATRGRYHDEAESRSRTPFQRDRDRVIHTAAFRRLMHKTQVFISHEGDHYRTRLTHSLEVAQISRSIARTLALDEDLAETVALAHDLGHPPFGHTGEDVLIACMAPYGGFDHNAQTLRLLTTLERRKAAYKGLNLTWETLEGVVKHNGPVTAPGAAIRDYVLDHDLWLGSYPSLEAQVAAVADDIAYNNHDVEDGLRAGLFTFEEAEAQPLVGPVLRAARAAAPGEPHGVVIAEAVSMLIGLMVDDVVTETRRRLARLRPAHADDIRHAGALTADFSDAVRDELQGLRDFLHKNMYRHFRVNRARSKARRTVRALFDLFFAEPEILPPEWRGDDGLPDLHIRARTVCDYIAGMTDRYAIKEHRRLFGDEGLV